MELQNQLKQMAAKAALDYVVEGEYLGVGTGTTISFFITELATSGKKVKGCISSSEATTRQLLTYGLPVCDLNEVVDYIPVYIDGCDEIDGNFYMIKGGGGALTREKIVAQASEQFVCIADESKVVKQLGKFPLPIEVIPMAVNSVCKELEALGGQPVVRDFITDNGNNIIDVHGLQIKEPQLLENAINRIPGVVTCGIFANRGADVLLVASEAGVKTLKPKKGFFSGRKNK